MEIELFHLGCPVCRKNTETRHHCYLDGHEYIQCQDCELIYQIGRVDFNEVLACYTGGFLKRSRRRLLNRFRKIENQYDFDLRMTRARRIFDFSANQVDTQSGNYLDIGCNKGFNLYAANEKGWEPYGIELIEEIMNVALQNGRL